MTCCLAWCFWVGAKLTSIEQTKIFKSHPVASERLHQHWSFPSSWSELPQQNGPHYHSWCMPKLPQTFWFRSQHKTCSHWNLRIHNVAQLFWDFFRNSKDQPSFSMSFFVQTSLVMTNHLGRHLAANHMRKLLAWETSSLFITSSSFTKLKGGKNWRIRKVGKNCQMFFSTFLGEEEEI